MKKCLLSPRYPKIVSSTQIQTQKLSSIQVRPTLYLDTSQPCRKVTHLVSRGVNQAPDGGGGMDQVPDLVDSDDGPPAAGREAAEDDCLVLPVADEGSDCVLGHQAPVEVYWE